MATVDSDSDDESFFQNIEDNEIVFLCENPAIHIPQAGPVQSRDSNGSCTGVVMTFLASEFGRISSTNWFAEMQVERITVNVIKGSGDSSSRFYVNAKILQYFSLKNGDILAAHLQNSDKTKIALVPRMYQMLGLHAKCVPMAYVDAAGGRSLMIGMKSKKFSVYHVSLQGQGAAHAIAVLRKGEEYVLFDPNRGLFRFANFGRFARVIVSEFTPFQIAVSPPGEYCKYSKVCWWGIS